MQTTEDGLKRKPLKPGYTRPDMAAVGDVAEWLGWQRVRFILSRGDGREPDIVIPIQHIALWVRRADACFGRKPEEQEAWQMALADAGWDVNVCYGAEKARAWLRELGLERPGYARPEVSAVDRMRTGRPAGGES